LGPQRVTKPTIRLLTWNIHGALGRNPRFDLERVMMLIRGWQPDLIALQEVDSRRKLPNGGDPFHLLQDALGKHGVSARSITTADGHYGQMLISCCPIRDSEVIDISAPEREPRRAIKAEVETPAGLVRIVATHLGLSVGERRGQARKLIELAGEPGMTTVVLGDFNDWFWPGSVHGVLARELPGRSRFRTFPSFCPVLRLDRIFCRPAASLRHCFRDPAARYISDHLPVIADIALTPT
jgi:endonuclease/exonuclease/phosphatase family metal-dependent hydrolase